MSMRNKKTLLVLLLSAICYSVGAHDFSVTLNGQKIYFNISSQRLQTAEVTYCGSITNATPSNYEGELTVPTKVRYNDVVYTVTGIRSKAFCGADKLTSVILPSNLKYIGDFAFEGCTSLNKVVFPGNPVKFGEGVFFKCDKLQNISLGSDWKEVNLQMFRWSTKLTSITIPAKIEKIKNLKSLKYLRAVYVDKNNARFSDRYGVLYDKDQKKLYGCPRAFYGSLYVPYGVETIVPGALIDCTRLTEVDLPSSLKSLSFREFSRMECLKEVSFRSETPIMTAQCGSRKVFLLQFAVPKVKVSVPKKARKLYRETVVTNEGDYTEIDGKIPYKVEYKEMLLPKYIVKR